MNETWKDIPGYEGLYQASNFGRIRSIDRVVTHYRGGDKKLRGKVLTPNHSTNNCGHLKVTLSKKGKRTSKLVHQLVAETWLGPCPKGCQMRHGPAGSSDNSVQNLQYGTHSENALDKRRDKTDGGRRVVRSDGVEFQSMAIAAEETGCRQRGVAACCRGKSKTSGGFSWRYQ